MGISQGLHQIEGTSRIGFTWKMPVQSTCVRTPACCEWNLFEEIEDWAGSFGTFSLARENSKAAVHLSMLRLGPGFRPAYYGAEWGLNDRWREKMAAGMSGKRHSLVGERKVAWVFMDCLGAVLLIHKRCLDGAFRPPWIGTQWCSRGGSAALN